MFKIIFSRGVYDSIFGREFSRNIFAGVIYKSIFKGGDYESFFSEDCVENIFAEVVYEITLIRGVFENASSKRFITTKSCVADTRQKSSMDGRRCMTLGC